VTVEDLQLLSVDDGVVRIAVACSSGFYVRSLAHDLGTALHVGAHLAALRRTQASGRTLAEAVPLANIEEPTTGLSCARMALIPLAEVLPDLPRLTLTPDGVRRAASGCDVGGRDFVDRPPPGEATNCPARVRLLDSSQNLVGIADATPAGLLHPVVVLM
jgi:tRNA pseudouridine55 synthase